MRFRRLVVGLATLAFALAGCGDDDTGAEPPPEGQTAAPSTTTAPDPDGDSADPDRFPDVVAATIVAQDDGRFRIEATVSSPYDSPERYADAWRVVTTDGAVLGVRELLHDHAGEQPFTRSLSDVEIAPEIATVVVEARDSTHGWGGASVEVDVAHPG